MSAVDDDDDDNNDNDKGIVKNTRWISTFMNAVADDDDDDNDNDEGIVKNTMWISTFMNAVDDNDDDNDSDKAFLGRPESAKSNGLFAQIDIWHQSISKNKVPETSICESVLHNLDTPPPGVEFWRTEVRFVLCIT